MPKAPLLMGDVKIPRINTGNEMNRIKYNALSDKSKLPFDSLVMRAFYCDNSAASAILCPIKSGFVFQWSLPYA
jgi:hypothetical protein